MLQVALGTAIYPKHQYKLPKNVGNLKLGRTHTDLERVAALDARYADLLTKTPWIASVTITRLDKQGGAAD